MARHGGMAAPGARLSDATPPFAALPTAPGMARAHVRAVLAGWGLSGVCEDADLVTGELVANAVQASAGSAGGLVRVCVLAGGDVLTIEVWDQAPGVPVLREASGLAESGRGLAIVDNLTNGSWGCQPAIGQRGKCVWAELPLPGAGW